MANMFKKLIAGISTVAILATTAVVPVMASEDKPVIDHDYTAGDTDELWTSHAGEGVVTDITDEGLTLSSEAKGQRYIGMPVAVSGNAVVEYDVKVQTTKGATTIWLGSGTPAQVTDNPTAVASIVVNAGAAAGKVNGVDVTFSGASGNATPWLHIKQVLNAGSQEVATTIISETEETIYDGIAPYVTADVAFAEFGVSVGRGDGAPAKTTFKNLKIYTVERVPSIALEDVTRIEVGTSEKIATVTDADDISVELTDSDNFAYEVDDEGNIYVSANEAAAQGAETTVNITATAEVAWHRSVTVYAKTAKEIISDIIEGLDISGGAVLKNEDGTYTALGNFTVPVADGIATISWSSDNPAITVSENGKVTVNSDSEAEVTLTATVSYKGEEASTTFTVLIPTEKIFYDENFDDFASGTLIDLGNPSNTTYTDSKGMTFTCGSRGQDTAVTGAAIAGSSDKYLTLKQTKYTGQGRQPKVNLSRTGEVEFTKSVTISVDIMFSSADAANQLLFIDSSSKQIKIPAPEDAYLGKWLHYDITQGSGGTLIMVTDTDGKGVDYIVSSDTIKNIAQMAIDDVTVTEIAVNNLKISDANMTIPPASIVEAGKHKLEITDLAKKNDVYTADTDFTLPAAPTGVKVSWAVMQKPKSESKWVDSSLISIAGTAATINPTSDVDDLDVKLVATITAGDASDTKEFAIDLPNPMDEITGFTSAAIPVVNTTDTDAKDKTITFDLSKDAVLKYDLALPIKSKTYKNTTIAWTSSDESKIAIAEDGTAKIMTSDLDIHDVTLTAVVTYKKGNITYSSEPQKFDIKMGYTSEDVASEDATLGKYKVRFDAAYDANFTSIPSTTTSSITFPEKGYFGSSFTWNSSVPTVISNQGKYTRPSTTKSVVLTVSIESGSAKESKQFNVTVPGSAGSSGGGGGGGGGSVSSSGTVSRPNSTGSISTSTTTAVQGSTATNGADIVDKLLEEKEQANDMFADVKDAAWARTEINGLAKAGIINGISDTQFAPNATVTRAEFAKMLMGAFGLSSASYTTSSFGDVATDAWYFQDVETAYNLGIINGVEDGVFAPDALITRQDMAVMVTRAADTAGKTIAEVNAGIAFADAGLIGSYAQTSVDRLVKAGIINGVSDTSFAPLDNATRAQAAKILYNFL